MHGGPIALLLMLLGAGTVFAGGGTIAASVVYRAEVEQAVGHSIGAIARAETGLSQMEQSYGEASEMLPQVADALGQAARITGAASGVLGETREAAVEMTESLRLLGRDLETLAGQLSLLGRSGQLRKTAEQVRETADQLEEANAEVAKLRTQVDALAPIMTDVSNRVYGIERKLTPSREALPDLRQKLARTRARIDPAAITGWLLLAVRIAAGLALLLGLALWGIGSTRRRMARMVAEMRPAAS